MVLLIPSLKDFARSELFKSEIVIESLRIAFGSMEMIRDVKYYGYSNEDHSDEWEIPPYMVAVAATAVSFDFFYLSVHSFLASGLRYPAKYHPRYQHHPTH
jgi:hypothetical protein